VAPGLGLQDKTARRRFGVGGWDDSGIQAPRKGPLPALSATCLRISTIRAPSGGRRSNPQSLGITSLPITADSHRLHAAAPLYSQCTFRKPT